MIHHHSPTQAGLDILRSAATFRRILFANIDPFLSLEAKTELKAEIYMMDYNELRASVIALNNKGKQP